MNVALASAIDSRQGIANEIVVDIVVCRPGIYLFEKVPIPIVCPSVVTPCDVST
jgi:hypothetical protein